MTAQEKALKKIADINRKYKAAERFTWNRGIINDIRRMRSQYCEQNGKRPNRIFLDTKAESRLTAWMVCHCISQDDDKQVNEILDGGIRKMEMKMYGMEIFFDCPEFCVDE